MNIGVALVGQLIDMATSLQIARSHQFSVAAPEDRERCRVLADQIAALRRDVKERQLPQPFPSRRKRSRRVCLFFPRWKEKWR